MILHKICPDPEGLKWLPYALGRARALEALYGQDGFAQEKHDIDNFIVEIQHSPPYQFIRIIGAGNPGYEFYTSDHVTGRLGSPDHIAVGSPPNNYVCGSLTRARFNKKGEQKVTPIYSSVIAPGDDDKWTERDCEAPIGIGDGKVITSWSWQGAKYIEHAWWPDNGNDALVTSTQAHAQGVSNKCNQVSPYMGHRFIAGGAFISDFGLDVYPTLYRKSGRLSVAPVLEHSWLNWRRAAVQKKDGRSFFISTDNYGRFQVYPATPHELNVALPGEFKTVTPPYPGWVTVPDPGDYTKQTNDWLWRFNKDATKCVAIPFHAEDTGFFKYLFTLIATMTPAEAATVQPSPYVVPAHEDTPGLVEFGIEITVTGPQPMDFEVGFRLLRNDYFGTSNRFYFDAAYFLKDVEGVGIVEDALMTAELELKAPPGYYDAGPINLGTVKESVDAFEAGNTSLVIRANEVEVLREVMQTTLQARFPTLAAIELGAAPGVDRGAQGQALPLSGGGSAVFYRAGPVSLTDQGVGPTDFVRLDKQFAFKAGFIYALELATFSIVYEVDDYSVGTYRFRGLHYGQPFLDEVAALPGWLPDQYDPSTYPASTVPVPSARAHQWPLYDIFAFQWGQGFCVHPAGHWSLAATAELGNAPTTAAQLDIVKVKTATGHRTYSHKELFNQAFQQSRDYTFYSDYTPPDDFFDHGGFRTAGIWTTFK